MISNESERRKHQNRSLFKHQEDKKSPDWCGSVGWALSQEMKGRQLDSRQVQSLVRVPLRGNQLMFLSHITVSLPFFPLKINK